MSKQTKGAHPYSLTTGGGKNSCPGVLTKAFECDKLVLAYSEGWDMPITVESADLISIQQSAKMLGKPRSTIYRWVGNGRIIAIRLGGILFVPRSEIERLVNKKAPS